MACLRSSRRSASRCCRCATRSTGSRKCSCGWSSTRALMSEASAAATGTMAPSVNATRWVGFATIVIREYSRIVRIWGQTLVPSAVTAILYFVIFGSLIGRRVGQMGGFDYMQYIAPGLIMMSVITNSYGNVVSSFFGAKFGKHVEELLVSPLPNWIIVAGYATGGLVRGLMVGGVVTIVSLIFAHLQVQHPLVILAAGLLTSL